MKKNKTVKRIIIILSVICVLAATIIAINAAEPSDEYGKEIASGKFDQYGLWTLYDSGTMVCSGTAFDSSQPLTVSPSKIDSEYSDAVIKIVFDVNCECIGSLYSSFKSFRNLETVEMPDSVDTIASSTFQGCSALADIKFSSSLKEIGSSAFRDCTSLNNIDLPASLEKIGSNAFNNTGFYNTAGNWINTYFLYCGRNLVSVSSSINISSVKISDKTKLIADSAFSGLGRIEEISIPDSVKVIPLSCFENMKALKKVTMTDSITEIRQNAFNRCTSLEEIKVSRKLVSIDDNAFRDCTMLKKIDIPSSIEMIGEYTFFDSGVKEISLPENLKNIGKIFNSFSSDNYTIYYQSDKNDWLNLIGKDQTFAYYRDNFKIYYKMTSPAGDISVQYTDGDFEWDVGNLKIAFETLSMDTPAAEQYGAFIYRNKAQSKNLYAVTLMDSFGEKAQPLDDHPVRVGFKIGKDTPFNERSFIYHWFSEKIENDFEKIPYDKLVFDNGWVYFDVNHFSDFAYCNEITEEDEYVLGDISGDGYINSEDALLALKHSVNLENLTGSKFLAGDVTKDNAVNSEDALSILKYSVNLITHF